MPSGEFARLMKDLTSFGESVVISVTKASASTNEQKFVGVYASHESRLVRLLPVPRHSDFSLRQCTVASPPAVQSCRLSRSW